MARIENGCSVEVAPVDYEHAPKDFMLEKKPVMTKLTKYL